MDEFKNNEHQEVLHNGRVPFVERYRIHPLLFAGLVLCSIFILYQVGGGLLSFVISEILQKPLLHVSVLRWSAVIGQVFFIFVPTIALAKLLTLTFKDVFRLRIPTLKESTFALLSMLVLQWLFDVYKELQNLIPIPVYIEELLRPWKQMILEMTKTIAQAHSIPELFLVLLVVAVMPSIIEECLFRGLVQRTFEYVFSPFVAAVFSGALFGVFHLNPFDLVPLVGIGIFLALLRYRSQTIVLPIVAHFLNNAVAIFALYMGYDEETSSLASSLGTYGIPFLLLYLLLVGMIFIIAFRLYLKSTTTIQQSSSLYE
ncbi:MAG: CPBP family intramembrane metalloprotease [Bacteroidetes bacterium]|nr:CPBP family intramembrane metalloprotease [Bacteroidota bacterium]